MGCLRCCLKYGSAPCTAKLARKLNNIHISVHRRRGTATPISQHLRAPKSCMDSAHSAMLLALPAEIRATIFEHIFYNIHIIPKRRALKLKASNLSICFVCKSLRNDCFLQDALLTQAVLVLHGETDWINIFRRFFNNSYRRNTAVSVTKMPSRLKWVYPENLGQSVASCNFFREVTSDRLKLFLQQFDSLVIVIPHNCIECADLKTLVRIQNKEHDEYSDLYTRSFHVVAHHMRPFVSFSPLLNIWSAFASLANQSNPNPGPSKRLPQLSVELPVALERKDVGHWNGGGWEYRGEELMVTGIMSLNDFILRAEYEGERYELQQEKFDIAASCPRCGFVH